VSQCPSDEELKVEEYKGKDAAVDTDGPETEVRKAWPDARGDAQAACELPERKAKKKALNKERKKTTASECTMLDPTTMALLRGPCFLEIPCPF
jgi:hypothetical protein